MIVKNPVLRGFYPDPSVCKVNGKFYMVCSSFQYFPGVPIFESKDLIHWRQIGHCLTRPSQVALREVGSSGGVFAPTIRYHDSRFYMVTTNDTYHKNFYVTTEDIYGEWSDPVFVDQDGIDPSLFFEDGRTYFMSNGSDENGNGCIFQCEINEKTGERLTESRPIWGGTGGKYLESPHLYRFGDWYYLMAAEGGTEFGHMITYARGMSPYGPFQAYEKNPVLTNRNLGGPQSLIQGIGHGDLIQDDRGNTYMLCLGFRQADVWVPFHHLGREVFLAPVTWNEDGWFTAGANGTVRKQMEMVPVILERRASNDRISDRTEEAEFLREETITIKELKEDSLQFCYLRDPIWGNYEIQEDKICLKGTNVTIQEASIPTFLGIRQKEFMTDVSANVKIENGEAGIAFYMDENHHYDIAVIVDEHRKKHVILRLCVGDLKTIVASVDVLDECDRITLKVSSDPLKYSFSSVINQVETLLGTGQAKYLSSEVAGGFTGVVMGMYAQHGELEEDSWAEFTDLTWKQVAE